VLNMLCVFCDRLCVSQFSSFGTKSSYKYVSTVSRGQQSRQSSSQGFLYAHNKDLLSLNAIVLYIPFSIIIIQLYLTRMSEKQALLELPTAKNNGKNETTITASTLLNGEIDSVLFTHWKSAVSAAWILFLSIHFYLWYDRVYNNSKFCPYTDENDDDMYWNTTFVVFGGFLMIWLALLMKFFFLNEKIEVVPILVALNIVTMGTLSTMYQLTLDKGSICVDVLGVASPATIWAEWLACGPLLVFITVSVVDKKELSTQDKVYISTFWLCLLFGFLIIFEQPYWLAMFWLVLSCLFYVPMMYLPWYDEDTTDFDSEILTGHLAEMKEKRLQLIIWLSIILPLFTINYLVAMWGFINIPTTVIIYQVLSVLTKGLFAACVMDIQMVGYRELEKRLVQEQNANEARRNFMKYIFHEVRTPLNSLSMGIDILYQNKLLTESDIDSLDGMKLATSFMSNTLNDVLNMQKIEEGKFELEMAPFDIRLIITTVFATFRGSALGKKLQLISSISPNFPKSIVADRFRIEHVVSNLLSNAIKFSSPNKKVIVDISFLKLEPVSTDERVQVNVSVIDEGPGISTENLPRLFQNFVQIRPNNLQKGQGSGLGLALCKEIISLHGGTIEVMSTVDVGSNFKFSIPCVLDNSYIPSYGTLDDKISTQRPTLDNDKLNKHEFPNALVVDGACLKIFI
jgi:signal transduction histidine kinase